jgi:tRNA pseudouridine32 synthase/23S rRNA pseudouridine746 synthase
MKKFTFKKKVEHPIRACDFFASHTGISKTKIKDAMAKGAAWITKQRGKRERIRRATAYAKPGDALELYYDEELINIIPPEAKCIKDYSHYSIWHKPTGLLTQGTNFGDHCSLERQAELFFNLKRQIFIVHRLDREVSGLIILAHDKLSAAKLSSLFQTDQIEKLYQIEVLGDLAKERPHGTIDLALDGKASITDFEVKGYDPLRNVSSVDVRIRTGRLHQIRRHFAMIGYPVMGDPRYGKGNKNTEGIKMKAVALKFICPFKKKELSFTLDEMLEQEQPQP